MYITGLFASIVAENLQGNELMLRVLSASQFDSLLNSVINSVLRCFIFGQTTLNRLPEIRHATPFEAMIATGTACLRCYIRFSLPIAFASVVPKASTRTMPDSITTNFIVKSSSGVTQATAVTPAILGTHFAGYYCL